MELFQILNELWNRKVWVILAALVAAFAALAFTYDVTLNPPAIEDKRFTVASAQTQFLVDSGQDPLVDTGASLEPLSARAQIYARLMSSDPVQRRIAKEAGLPLGAINASGPVASDSDENDGAQSAQERNSQLAEEVRNYRLSFLAVQQQPIVTVFAEGPDLERTVKLADSAVKAFNGYLRQQQQSEGVPRDDLVQLRQLGDAEGAVLRSEAARPAVGVLAFGGTFVALCFLILVLSGASRRFREQRTFEQQSAAAAQHDADRGDDLNGNEAAHQEAERPVGRT